MLHYLTSRILYLTDFFMFTESLCTFLWVKVRLILFQCTFLVTRQWNMSALPVSRFSNHCVTTSLLSRNFVTTLTVNHFGDSSREPFFIFLMCTWETVSLERNSLNRTSVWMNIHFTVKKKKHFRCPSFLQLRRGILWGIYEKPWCVARE